MLQLVSGSPTPLPYAAYVNFPKSALGTPVPDQPGVQGPRLDPPDPLNEHALTGTAKLQYKFTPDAMAYASYSRGNLVGGFNLAEVTKPFGAGGAPNTSLAPQTDTSFPDENVDAYEIGAKTTIFDRRVSLNGALFYQKYYDHQLNAFTGTQFVEFTIPSAIAEGVELEIGDRRGDRRSPQRRRDLCRHLLSQQRGE